jgi:hypothetical protein
MDLPCNTADDHRPELEFTCPTEAIAEFVRIARLRALTCLDGSTARESEASDLPPRRSGYVDAKYRLRSDRWTTIPAEIVTKAEAEAATWDEIRALSQPDWCDVLHEHLRARICVAEIQRFLVQLANSARGDDGHVLANYRALARVIQKLESLNPHPAPTPHPSVACPVTSPEQEPRITAAQAEILDKMLVLNAVDCEHAVRRADISEKVVGSPNEFACDRGLKKLRELGLVDSMSTRYGGCWLTSRGLACASSRRDRRGPDSSANEKRARESAARAPQNVDKALR